MDDYYTPASEQHIKKERRKARDLKKTQWWMNQLSVGECYYCGSIFKRDQLTMDHKVPLARGGVSSRSNIVVCCKECNNQKKAKTPAEMIMAQEPE